jgi:hypothetical protein
VMTMFDGLGEVSVCLMFSQIRAGCPVLGSQAALKHGGCN